MTIDDPLLDRLVAAVGDEYELEGELGRGGMAVVYRARDRRLRRLVAIKLLPPDLAFRAEIRSRFMREAETAAHLSHPNIVPIFSVGERGGLVYFVMGLVDGPTLAELLHADPMPPVERVREILRETADALDYAHHRGVVHRDIKPDNILVDRATGRAMVTDFGIARAAEAGQRLTQTGIAVGTPTYMSPEQAMGEREVDGRADVYSLGVVGYQMLAGTPPFAATGTPAMLMKHISERPKPLADVRPGLPPNLVAAIERALAKGPDERWPTAAAFRDALAAEATPAPEARRHAPQELTPPEVARSSRAASPPAPAPSAPHALPELPPFPLGGGRAGREMRREWKREVERRTREYARGWEASAPREHAHRRRIGAPKSDEERVADFRRNLAGSSIGILSCWAINLATSPHFFWAVFPTIGMGIGLASHAAGLWSRGVSIGRIFARPEALPRGPEGKAALGGGAPHAAIPSQSSVAEEAARLVPADALAGPYGAALRRAVEDRAAILGIVERLPKEDRALLPDIAPTIAGLMERIAGLVATLHRLAADIEPGAVVRLDERIAALGDTSASADKDRTRSLLERQRASIQDLLERRERLQSQLESAGLVLQNLKLDLLKLRSAGIASSLDDVTSATQEARALSRDIGHVLDAAAQVRAL